MGWVPSEYQRYSHELTDASFPSRSGYATGRASCHSNNPSNTSHIMQEVMRKWFGEVYARPPMSSLLGESLIQQLTEKE